MAPSPAPDCTLCPPVGTPPVSGASPCTVSMASVLGSAPQGPGPRPQAWTRALPRGLHVQWQVTLLTGDLGTQVCLDLLIAAGASHTTGGKAVRRNICLFLRRAVPPAPCSRGSSTADSSVSLLAPRQFLRCLCVTHKGKCVQIHEHAHRAETPEPDVLS